MTERGGYQVQFMNNRAIVMAGCIWVPFSKPSIKEEQNWGFILNLSYLFQVKSSIPIRKRPNMLRGKSVCGGGGGIKEPN